MSQRTSLRMGESLQKAGLITPLQLAEVLEIQKVDRRKIGEIIVEKGFATERQICEALSRMYVLPFVDLKTVYVKEDVFAAVDVDLVRRYQVFPIKLEGKVLTLAINNPLEFSVIQEIQYATGFQVSPVLSTLSDIDEKLSQCYEAMQSAHNLQATRQGTTDSAPVVQFVESLLAQAIKERVSDIHLEPMEEHMRVRFRVDGVLYEKQTISKAIERKIVTRIKILSGMDVANSRTPQDGRMSTPEEIGDYDIRVSTLPNIMGENVVLRILDKSGSRFTLETLGMSADEQKKIKELIKRPYGMVLLTGPTGVGKTTTLYSLLNILNQTTRNIITIEDPVEYKIPGVNQTAINTRSSYTFATAIRHILRHDPDVIMVGEIRDMETAAIATRAALTGHLVLSTLHTNTACAAIMRLLDMKIEPFLIQSSVIAVVAQRLLRRLCPHCCQEYEVKDDMLQALGKMAPLPSGPIKMASPVGCEQCFHTGYIGRIAIYEILELTDNLRHLILKDPSEQELSRVAVKAGMRRLRQTGIEKALARITSMEEVLSQTYFEQKDYGVLSL